MMVFVRHGNEITGTEKDVALNLLLKNCNQLIYKLKKPARSLHRFLISRLAGHRDRKSHS